MGDRIEIDFRHFIKLAKGFVVSWASLSTLLNEMASNFVLSKELNNVLLEELKLSETKLHEILSKNKDADIEAKNPNELNTRSDRNISLSPESDNLELENNVNNENDAAGNEILFETHQGESDNGTIQNETIEVEQDPKSESDVEIVANIISKNKLECRICWKRFSSKSIFDLHEKNHKSEKPQECKTCGQRLTLSCIMNKHKSIRTKEILDIGSESSNTELEPEELENDSLTPIELTMLKVDDIDHEYDTVEHLPTVAPR